MATKTIKKWLQDLPEPQKSEALANLYIRNEERKALNIKDALIMAFSWSETKQGYEYLAKFCFSL